MTSRAAALAATGLVLAAAGCGAGRAPVRGPADIDVFAIYRATVDRTDGERTTFRLMLHAALPDRIHAEVLGPGPGGPAMILDAGGGRVCVAVPSERLAYVGDGRASVLDRLVGVPLSLSLAARAILYGDTLPEPLTIERTGDRLPGLPVTLVLAGPGGTLRLTRTTVKPLRRDAEALGTADPPAGFELRPLDAWPGALP